MEGGGGGGEGRLRGAVITFLSYSHIVMFPTERIHGYIFLAPSLSVRSLPSRREGLYSLLVNPSLQISLQLPYKGLEPRHM